MATDWALLPPKEAAHPLCMPATLTPLRTRSKVEARDVHWAGLRLSSSGLAGVALKDADLPSVTNSLL